MKIESTLINVCITPNFDMLYSSIPNQLCVIVYIHINMPDMSDMVCYVPD